MTQIWAHRGASHYAPENTLPAFELAHEMGADGIELDVHLTRDGALAVAHDFTVDRCSSSTGRIAEMTAAQLKELDFSNHKSGYHSTRLPLLEEVYAWLKHTDMVVNVEIKSGEIIYGGIEEKLTALAKAMNVEDRVFYSSFDHYSLMRLRAVNPQARTAPLYSEAMYAPWRYAKAIGAQAIHPAHITVNFEDYVTLANEAGILVNVWTVDDPARIAELARQGVNAIITNVPDVARLIRDQYYTPSPVK